MIHSAQGPVGDAGVAGIACLRRTQELNMRGAHRVRVFCFVRTVMTRRAGRARYDCMIHLALCPIGATGMTGIASAASRNVVGAFR